MQASDRQIEVEFTTGDGILHARVSGSFGPEADEWADRAIARRCREEGATRLLIDFRDVEGSANPALSYRSGVALEERGFTREMRIACLDRPEYRAANELYGLVARNRGFDLQHFYAIEDALAWLGR